MVIKTYFITGAEGVGKSTILEKIKIRFPFMKIYDFDEVGVPDNPPLSWRLNTTKHWIKKFIKNQKAEASSCVLGLCFPEEIKKMNDFEKLNNVSFCLLDVNKKERKKRLINRKASQEVIDDDRCLLELRSQFQKMKNSVIDTSNLSIEEVSNSVIKFMELNNGDK